MHFKSPTVSNTGEQDWDLMRSAGGYYDGDEYKIEYNPDGSVLCAFKGSTGYKEVFSAPLTLNQWHTVQCVKTATQVKTIVDGVTTTGSATIGTIVLTRGLIFGAHPSATETGASEFFRGQLDEASIAIGSRAERGSPARGTAPRLAACPPPRTAPPSSTPPGRPRRCAWRRSRGPSRAPAGCSSASARSG